MNIYDFLVSVGEETAANFKNVFHDLDALFVVLLPFAFLMAGVVTIFDALRSRRRRDEKGEK